MNSTTGLRLKFIPAMNLMREKNTIFTSDFFQLNVNMEVFQVAHDLANDYFNCHMKNSCSFTHNISKQFSLFLILQY